MVTESEMSQEKREGGEGVAAWRRERDKRRELVQLMMVG